MRAPHSCPRVPSLSAHRCVQAPTPTPADAVEQVDEPAFKTLLQRCKSWPQLFERLELYRDYQQQPDRLVAYMQLGGGLLNYKLLQCAAPTAPAKLAPGEQWQSLSDTFKLEVLKTVVLASYKLGVEALHDHKELQQRLNVIMDLIAAGARSSGLKQLIQLVNESPPCELDISPALQELLQTGMLA